MRFRRPASESGRTFISGSLISCSEARYMRGNVPRTGYLVSVGHDDKWGKRHVDSFGPLPANYPITVGGLWETRKPQWLLDLEAEEEAEWKDLAARDTPPNEVRPTT